MVERALKAVATSRCCWWISPRDVEPEVGGKLANAYLYSVDDLQSIISHNLAQRPGCGGGRKRLLKEASEFMAATRLGASETIREYRDRSERIRDELTTKAVGLGAAMRKPSCRIWHETDNRLIHAPAKSTGLRDGDDERLNILRDSLGTE